MCWHVLACTAWCVWSVSLHDKTIDANLSSTDFLSSKGSSLKFTLINVLVTRGLSDIVCNREHMEINNAQESSLCYVHKITGIDFNSTLSVVQC